MSKHDNHGKSQAKPDPKHPDKFEGSTFAPLVPEGAPTDVAGYVTAPDSHGACRYTASENYYNDKSVFPHGPPADACRKFITHGTIAAFGVVGYVADSINYNTGKANLFAGLAYGADSKTPQMCDLVESHGSKHLSDTLAFRGPGADGTPAVTVDEAVASWRQTGWYPRTPFANATDAPLPLGGG